MYLYISAPSHEHLSLKREYIFKDFRKLEDKIFMKAHKQNFITNRCTSIKKKTFLSYEHPPLKREFIPLCEISHI